MTITNVIEYVTTNSRKEKVQVRTYDSGHERCFIFQGGRWYPLERRMFNEGRKDNTIVKEEDFLKYRLEEWGL